MREMSAEADLAILVRDRCRQQNVRVQQAVFIGDGIAVVQAEDEALAGNTGQGGMRHAILVRFRFQDLLLLDHADPGGQIVIDRNDAGIDHRGHMILCLQHHIIACAVEEIPRWGGYLCDVVMPNRQRGYVAAKLTAACNMPRPGNGPAGERGKYGKNIMTTSAGIRRIAVRLMLAIRARCRICSIIMEEIGIQAQKN